MQDSGFIALRKNFPRIGFALFTIITVRIVLTLLFQSIFSDILNATEKSWEYFILYITATYLVGMPIAVIIIRHIPSEKKEGSSLTIGQVFSALIICLFINYSVGLIGNYVNSLIGVIAQRQTKDLLQSMLLGSNIWASLTVVGILGPVLEELFFRRLLINKLRKYGEWTAVLVSALIFGINHGNIMQLFYTIPLGLAFGYIYIKTGRLIYSIIIHMTINIIGVLVMQYYNSAVIMRAYAAFMLAVLIAGLVLLLIYRKRIRFNKWELTGWKRAALLNIGMILFFAACATLFVLNTAAAFQ